MIPHVPLAVLALLLAGCDGPREQAGERADVRAGLTDTVGSLKSGPMERAGEKLDEQEAREKKR
jgi:hypothetical protein